VRGKQARTTVAKDVFNQEWKNFTAYGKECEVAWKKFNGLNVENEFEKIISTAGDYTKAHNTYLTARGEFQKKVDEYVSTYNITDEKDENVVRLQGILNAPQMNANILGSIQEKVKLAKARKKEVEVAEARKKKVEVKNAAKQIAKILVEKHNQRIKRDSDKLKPEIYTKNPIFTAITSKIIVDSSTDKTDLNILKDYIPLSHSKEYLSFVFDDLEKLELGVLTTSRTKLDGLYSFFRNLVYIKEEMKKQSMNAEEINKHEIKYEELNNILNKITEKSNLKDIESTIESTIESAIVTTNETANEKYKYESLDTIIDGKNNEENEENVINEENKLTQFKLNILRQFNNNIFLMDPETYELAKKILNKINLYRMILDIYIISKDQGQNEIKNKWGDPTKADLKVAHMFYMVLRWFDEMKNNIHENKTCELNPVEAGSWTIKFKGQSFLDVGKSEIKCDETKLTFTEKLTFLNNYNFLTTTTSFTKYYTYLNDKFGNNKKVFYAFTEVDKVNHKYVDESKIVMTKFDLNENEELITSLKTNFKEITKDYQGDDLPTLDNLRSSIQYARYIDVIEILKEKGIYNVANETIQNYINNYIDNGNKDFITINKKSENNDMQRIKSNVLSDQGESGTKTKKRGSGVKKPSKSIGEFTINFKQRKNENDSHQTKSKKTKITPINNDGDKNNETDNEENPWSYGGKMTKKKWSKTIKNNTNKNRK